MVTEQQKQLSPEAAEIHTLAIMYFNNAEMALLYEDGALQEPMNGELHAIAAKQAEERDKRYGKLLTQIVERLLTPGEVSFDKIIEQSIDSDHGAIQSFENRGGSFSAWLHQLKTDTIDSTAKITLKLMEDSEKLQAILKTIEVMRLTIIEVLKEDES